MNESSNVPDLNSDILVPVAVVEPPIRIVSNSLGGSPPPDIKDVAAKVASRFSPDLKTQIEDSRAAGTPSRLQDVEELLDPHKLKDAKLTLPGYNGSPFRGNAIPNIKEEDPDHKKPQLGLEPHLFILNLANEQDKIDYEGVLTLVANGYAVISVEERVYDNDIKNWRVFLRWAVTISYMAKSV